LVRRLPASRDFPLLVDLYLQGRLDLDRFVSETIALDGVEEASTAWSGGKCSGRSSSSGSDCGHRRAPNARDPPAVVAPPEER